MKDVRVIFESFNPSITKQKDAFGNYYNSDVHNIWIGFRSWYKKNKPQNNSMAINKLIRDFRSMEDNAWDRHKNNKDYHIGQFDAYQKCADMLQESLSCAEA